VAEDHSQNDLPPPESPRQPLSASSMKESDLPASIRENEYESGRVICEVCEEGVSIRDEETGGFSISKWTAHRKSWWAISECHVTAEGPFLIHSLKRKRTRRTTRRFRLVTITRTYAPSFARLHQRPDTTDPAKET